MKKTILITNDDGIFGAGLKPLINELKKIANVFVVVPSQEMSGTGHALTLHNPLKIQKIAPNTHLVGGTPADCVRYGVRYLLKNKVDLVVSGINTGPNLGQDVIYSGTVAGAREGAMLKVPSMAISVGQWEKTNYKLAATIAAKIVNKALTTKMPKGIFLNINIPYEVKGIKVVELGERIYDEEVECRKDPRGIEYYWLSGKFISGVDKPGTDINAINNDFVAITPLEVTPSATGYIEAINKWIKSLS